MTPISPSADRANALPLEQIRANILDDLNEARRWIARERRSGDTFGLRAVSHVWQTREAALEQIIKWIDGVCRCTTETVCELCEAPDIDENTCRNCGGRGWYAVVDVTAGAYRQPCGLCS